LGPWLEGWCERREENKERTTRTMVIQKKNGIEESERERKI